MYFSSFQASPAFIVNQKACESFDRFVDGRIVAHNNYDWEMVRKCDFPLKHVGFVNNTREFYATSSNEIILMEINEDFRDTKIITRRPFRAGLDTFSQNQHNKEMFIAAEPNLISILNIYSGDSVSIPYIGSQKEVTWIGKTSFAVADATGSIIIYELEEQKTEQTTKAFPMNGINKFISHPTEPFLLLASNNMIQLIDTRAQGSVMSMGIKEGATSINWMPGEKSGIIAGFNDGTLNLYSLSDRKTICTQMIASSPITSISFSPTKPGYAMMSCETDILFANLKVWGFGRMTISKVHQGHVGNVIDAQWWQGPECRVISCDDKNIINMFQMNDQYLPNIPMPSA